MKRKKGLVKIQVIKDEEEKNKEVCIKSGGKLEATITPIKIWFGE